jgi:hypothetical protein
LTNFSNDLGIGNWSADKSDYSTTTQADILYADITEPIAASLGNWSSDKTDYYTSTQTDTAIETANTSMKDYTDATFITQANEGNLDVNSSDYWDSYNTANTTQFEDNGGVLNIILSWFSSEFDSLFGDKDTDDLTEGSTNLYDNQSWNETYADTLYYDISNPSGFYNSSDFNIADYFTSTEILGFNYYNSSDFIISDYATNIKVDSLGNFSAYVQPTHLTNFTNDLGIGNWSADKSSYYTSTETDTAIETANTSMKGYVDGTFYLKTNPSGFYNSSDFSISNYFTSTQILGFNYYNSSDFSISDYYLDSNPDGFISSYTETDPLWTANQSSYSTKTVADTLYADITEPIASSLGNWSNDKSSYSTTTESNDLYRADSWDNFTGIPHATPSNGDITHFSYADEIYDWVIGLGYSTTSYVDILVGSIGNWTADKTDYSTTTQMNTAIETANTSLKDYADNTFLTSYTETDPLWTANQSSYSTKTVADGLYADISVVSNPFNQTLNTTSNVNFNNATIADCIIFASGGKICNS